MKGKSSEMQPCIQHKPIKQQDLKQTMWIEVGIILEITNPGNWVNRHESDLVWHYFVLSVFYLTTCCEMTRTVELLKFPIHSSCNIYTHIYIYMHGILKRALAELMTSCYATWKKGLTLQSTASEIPQTDVITFIWNIYFFKDTKYMQNLM